MNYPDISAEQEAIEYPGTLQCDIISRNILKQFQKYVLPATLSNLTHKTEIKAFLVKYSFSFKSLNVSQIQFIYTLKTV